MAANSPSCPACGTFLTVTHQSTVSMVCKRCHAVLEYRNGALTQVGNASVVVPTRASVQVGETGDYQGTNFQVTGHVQLSNQDGATWDEFYLGFADGQCGWLAQAQGRLILSFQALLPEDAPVPPFEALELNSSHELMPGLPALNVVEKGQATIEAASGQMPYLLRPGESYPYADFANMRGAFASVDYSTQPPDLFVGREITFDDLGMQARRQDATASVGSAAPMVCTECGARLEVRNPGKTERITCLQCRTVFDVTSGRPVHSGSQEDAGVHPAVPIGSQVAFGPQEYTLMGFLQRATTGDDGTTYAWQEYLLADSQGSYRWLVQDSESHWSLFEPITGGSDIQPVVNYGGKEYKFFQHGEARIVYLEGEFFWNAEVGQTSYTADFICPPYMLAGEFSTAESTKGETNWTHGVYVPVAAVRTALGARDIRSPSGVAPNQPFPHKAILPLWVLATAAVLALGIYFNTTVQPESVKEITRPVRSPDAREQAKNNSIASATILLQQQPIAAAACSSYFLTVPDELKPPPGLPHDVELVDQFKELVKLKGGKNIRVRAKADLKSTFLELSGILDSVDNDNKDEPTVQPFSIPIEFYSGVEDNEAWTEGDTEKAVYLSALPEGEYTLHIQVYRQKGVGRDPVVNRPFGVGMDFGARQDAPFVRSFTLHVEQGYPRWWNAVWACLALLILPLIVWLMSLSFEKRRWSNSNVNPAG